MSLPKFSYLAPRSLKEACALLIEHGDKARLMAGGTDLLIRMSHRAMTPEYVIGLRHLSGLDRIEYNPESGLSIGALARLADVANHSDVKKHYPALAYSAGVTATVQIRSMGTVIGNICNAAPSADNAAPLLIYDARVSVVSPGGERIIPLDEFFRGPGLTSLEMGEVVREIIVPAPGLRSGSDYQKLSARGQVDIAAIGAAAQIALDEDGKCVKARIGLGAVAPVPLRSSGGEQLLEGQTPTPELIVKAGAKAAGEARPISDVRASASYRRRMVDVLTVRALTRSLEIASEKMAGCEI